MRKLLPLLLLAALLLPVALSAMQDGSALRVEITGVNATELPTATITTNVYDSLGQPLRGLTPENFVLTGSLADLAQIVDVQNITDDNLPFATVLVIDVSSSMDGVNPATSPIQRAKDAASAFVQNIRPNDPVALVTFGSDVTIVQPYTTDKDVMLAAIEGIEFGGETALYQAGYDAVRLAAESPLSRRVVILLSDGAEYGGNGQVGRDAASIEALTRGVPVYTIGLGFGTDRTYLENLSTGTNALFYESPTPEELEGIYQELAALLRSQYVITLNADIPLDGTEYDFGIQVTTDAGTAEATSTLRAPIPVPVVRLDLPTTPVIQPVTITANVLADDEVTGVSFAFGDSDPVNMTTAPFSMSIDPSVLQPGDYPITVAATDVDGDTGVGSGTVTIGALPPVMTLDPNPSTLGEIADPVTVTVTTGGQTPVNSLTIAYDGGEAITLTEPYTFTIDPVQFTPGQHLVMVNGRNEGGQESIAPVAFNVAAIPPTVTIRGLEDGQSIDEPLTFTVSVVGQGEITAITSSVADTVITPDSAGLISLDPQFLVPGANVVTVSATSDNGMTGSTTVTVLVAALEPQILVSGITPDETINGDTDVSIDFFSQTPINNSTASVDGEVIAELTDDPAVFTITVLDFAPGEHILSIEAENSSGQTGSIEIPFSIGTEPAASATAAAQIQATATQAVIDATTTAEFSVQATQTAAVQISTTTAEALIAATQTAEVSIAATGTAVVLEGTLVAQSSEATATEQAAATQTADVNTVATATAVAGATREAQATQAQEQANIAAAATATANAELTEEANRQATQDAFATATSDAQSTSEANIQATQDAFATATRDAELTAEALAAEASATSDAIATATSIAQATQSVDATATGIQRQADIQSTVQVATRNALGTSAASARLSSQGTQDARSTRVARTATADAAAEIRAQTATSVAATSAAESAAFAAQTATAISQAIATQTAQAILDAAATATSDANATATIQQLSVESTATGEANATIRANLLATDEGATLVAQTDTVSTAVASTRAAVLAVTDAARTAVAQETLGAQQTAVAPTRTPVDSVAQAATDQPELTPTAQGTLTPLTTDAPPAGSDSTPIILVIVAIVVILLLLFFALRRGNNNPPPSQRR